MIIWLCQVTAVLIFCQHGAGVGGGFWCCAAIGGGMQKQPQQPSQRAYYDF